MLTPQVECLLDFISCGLPQDERADWLVAADDAIPVGADLSWVPHAFGVWLLRDSGLLTITDVNRAAVDAVLALHLDAASGQTVGNEQWGAARAAARSACAAAESDCSAADSAYRSAREWAGYSDARATDCAVNCKAAYQAANSAHSVAYSAADSDRSAAHSAYAAAHSVAHSGHTAHAAAYDSYDYSDDRAACDAAYAESWRTIAAKSLEIFASAPA